MTFMLFATYVIINILMAFVIDVYTSIEDSNKEEQEERNVIIDISRAQTLANKDEVKKERSSSKIVFGSLPKKSVTIKVPKSSNKSLTENLLD
jgi:archaellum component FlaF (FlaF/FlaG flagellin family)